MEINRSNILLIIGVLALERSLVAIAESPAIKDITVAITSPLRSSAVNEKQAKRSLEESYADVAAADNGLAYADSYGSPVGYRDYSPAGFANSPVDDAIAAGAYGPEQLLSHQVEFTKAIPVPVYKTLAVGVPQPVPYAVPQPVPVEVPQPVPVQVPVPVPVIKTLAYPVEKAVPYPVEKPYPVPVQVEKKVPITIYKPYPVHVPVYKIKHIYHHEPKYYHSYKGWN